MTRREVAAEVEELAGLTPVPEPEPHGLPTGPLYGLDGYGPTALRAAADAAEGKERAAAEVRQAAEDEYQRQRTEYARITEAAMPVYDEIAAAVNKAFPGIGSLARRLEIAEAAAMDAGRKVAGEEGAREVQGRLYGHRAERLRRFLNLLREDNPPGDRL
jgi:hypothetical protein